MKNTRLHQFQGYGVELEYMIVDKDTLAVRPITDELFKKVTGAFCSDVARDSVTWSNELVSHVLELKCTKPEADLVTLSADFQKNIQQINQDLATFNAMLMPSAAHPLMNPETDTKLWQHDSNDIYALYNKIFNCKGHGWSNLQSTHLNLPFYDDEEFARLHAAIRLVLPIIPALAASSPILDGKDTGYLDKRLDYYQKNQRIIPAINGKVIPEKAFSKRTYHKMIYDRIARDIKPYDEAGILSPTWVNSRGAIARFDRGAIEIRVIDIQECPNADLAILSLLIAVIKLLVHEKTVRLHEQQSWEVAPLYALFQKTIKTGEYALIEDQAYLGLFNITNREMTARELWRNLLALTQQHYPEDITPWVPYLEHIIDKGTLATRLMRAVGGNYTPEHIQAVYRRLCVCMETNEMFG